MGSKMGSKRRSKRRSKKGSKRLCFFASVFYIFVYGFSKLFQLQRFSVEALKHWTLQRFNVERFNASTLNVSTSQRWTLQRFNIERFNASTLQRWSVETLNGEPRNVAARWRGRPEGQLDIYIYIYIYVCMHGPHLKMHTYLKMNLQENPCLDIHGHR